MSNSEVGPSLPQGFPLSNHLLHRQHKDSALQRGRGEAGWGPTGAGGDAPVPSSGCHRLASPRDRTEGLAAEGRCWGAAA